MKLSFIFELLLIFILIAFAASASIDLRSIRGVARKHGKVANKKRQESTNKYCSCSTKICNCCREFNIPVVALQGPGCAALQYLKGDRLAISMSFGERVLTNTTISSKKPRPVCMPLPGGVSKFCGRVYNIGRKGDDFKACLGLELQSLNDVEAALRVSCFRFGPDGLRVEPSQPLPVVEEEDNDGDDDDDDDDDDDEDDYDFDDDDDDDDDDNEIDSVDYGGFSVFDDDFIGEYFASSGGNKKKKVQTTTTTKSPVRKVTRKPVAPAKIKRQPSTARPKPAPLKISTTTPTVQITQTMETLKESTNKPVVVEVSNDKLPSSSHESIAAVTAMLQNPQLSTVSSPDAVLNVSLTTMSVQEESTQKFETTTQLQLAETTISANKTKNEDKSDEDEDPISEVVEEVLEEEVESAESTTPQPVNDKDVTKPADNKPASKDVLDDIVDGMVDTFAGEDSDESSKQEAESTEDDDDDDEEDEDDDDDADDDDDDDEDDEESEGSNGEARKVHARKVKHRQSRDMWLERLHW